MFLCESSFISPRLQTGMLERTTGRNPPEVELNSCESSLLIEHDHLSYLKTLAIHGIPLPCKSSEMTTRFNDGPTSPS